jgi:outer membrane protein assembly factor BamB
MVARTLPRLVVAVLAMIALCAQPAAAQLLPLPPIVQPPENPPDDPDDPDDPRPPPTNPDPPPPATAPAPQVGGPPGTVTDGVNLQHTGFFGDETLVPPLARRWSVPFDARQLLAADGMVFAIGQTQTKALSLADGKVLWSRATAGRATYDGGRLFFATDDVQALDAATGNPLWGPPPSSTAFSGTPIASGGVVYAYFGDPVVAYDAATGAKLWSAATTNGGQTPALDDNHLYVAGACAQTRAHNRRTGEIVWSYTTGCSGGGSVTPTLFGGRLFVPDNDFLRGHHGSDAPVLDAATGSVVARYTPKSRVYVDGLGVSDTDAVDMATGAVAWKRKAAIVDEKVAVGHDIYGFGKGGLIAVDSESGATIWNDPLPQNTKDGYDDNFAAQLAPAPGALVVGALGYVSAYESYLRPDPNGIALGYDKADLAAGEASVVGVLGTAIKASRPEVAIEQAGWRRGAFRRVATAQPARDGGFAPRVPATRNARFRASTGGATSGVITVYVSPRIRLGKARAARAGRISVGATVVSPGPKLRGRQVVIYLDRAKTKKLTRIASATLRPAGRGGRTRANLVFRPLRKVGDNDLIYACVRGQLGLQMGRPSRFLRQCGARTIKE